MTTKPEEGTAPEDPQMILERRVCTITTIASVIAAGKIPSRNPENPGFIEVTDEDEDLLDLGARLATMLECDFDDKELFLPSILTCIQTAFDDGEDPIEALSVWVKAVEDSNPVN